MRELLLEKWKKPDTIFADEFFWWDDLGRKNSPFTWQPAMYRRNGYIQFLKNGEFHRGKNKPAIIFSNGDKEWWINGKFIKKFDAGINKIIFNSKTNEIIKKLKHARIIN